MIDAIEQNLLREVADLDSLPVGAYNIRANGQLAGRNTTANIDIVTKDDKPGIDIYIRPFTKNESVHIPVILSQTGLTDLVYNDFHIGDLSIPLHFDSQSLFSTGRQPRRLESPRLSR